MRRRHLQVKRKTVPIYVAIVGGSGAGKTWLAERLQSALAKEAVIVSLDNFYKDRAHLSSAQRHRINFDHPRAIDWDALKEVLITWKKRERVAIPGYDFSTHTRIHNHLTLAPKRLVILEGMWLLRPAWLRKLFALRIFIDCPGQTRRTRRIERDQTQRGRSIGSICHQFDSCVTPMHDRFVEPQKRWADIVLQSPLDDGLVTEIVTRIQNKLPEIV